MTRKTRTAGAAKIEKQRQLVAELTRRLAFETLLLRRLEARLASNEDPQAPPVPAGMAEILAAARRRSASP